MENLDFGWEFVAIMILISLLSYYLITAVSYLVHVFLKKSAYYINDYKYIKGKILFGLTEEGKIVDGEEERGKFFCYGDESGNVFYREEK